MIKGLIQASNTYLSQDVNINVAVIRQHAYLMDIICQRCKNNGGSAANHCWIIPVIDALVSETNPEMPGDISDRIEMDG